HPDGVDPLSLARLLEDPAEREGGRGGHLHRLASRRPSDVDVEVGEVLDHRNPSNRPAAPSAARAAAAATQKKKSGSSLSLRPIVRTVMEAASRSSLAFR